MNTCWKCGVEIPEGAECVACREGYSPAHTEQEMEEMEASFNRNFLQVDWSKIKTLRDLVAILAESGEFYYIEKDTPAAERLKKFLKPIE